MTAPQASHLKQRVAARRGICPGVARPMLTGDGLLVRVMPGAPVPIDTLVALCGASRRYGNGILEVTQRGSVQIRGLTESTAPVFARFIEAYALGGDDRPQLVQSPLSRLCTDELFDAQGLVVQLREWLADQPYLSQLGPKVSVLIDSGGKLHLDSIEADVRIRASAGGLHISIAGSASTAKGLGWIEQGQAVAAVDELLALIAARGIDARGKDLVCDAEVLLANRVRHGDLPTPRAAAQPVGRHGLQSGELALGIGLAFGYCNVGDLEKLLGTAAAFGATSVQPSPGRALLLIGLRPVAADALTVAAQEAGFVVDPHDPRRHVVACAGFPACASASLATRELAPDVSRIAKAWLNGSTIVHLSGCIKGCAHPGAATLTVAGPNRLVLGGNADDPAHVAICGQHLLAGFEQLSTAVAASGGSLSDLKSSQVVKCFTGVGHDN